jgi:hypothetical protein
MIVRELPRLLWRSRRTASLGRRQNDLIALYPHYNNGISRNLATIQRAHANNCVNCQHETQEKKKFPAYEASGMSIPTLILSTIVKRTFYSNVDVARYSRMGNTRLSVHSLKAQSPKKAVCLRGCDEVKAKLQFLCRRRIRRT